MIKIRISQAFRGAMGILIVFAAGNLFYSAWSAFMSGQFKLLDYGVYTNMIWNCGHGSPFRVLINESYLFTHLSFSLALIGPLFRLWDSALLLVVVQWSAVVLGGISICCAARRHRVPADMTLALVFFFFAYRLTQSALMAEFHGVTMFFLLVPWLYYCCAFRKCMAWLPLLLLLGVREDAFITALPLLLYFSVKDRWKGGYALAALALGYGLLAIFGLYPLINGVSLFERREKFLSSEKLFSISARDIRSWRWGAFMFFLPVLVLAGRKSLPMLIMPSAAYLVTLLSGVSTQQSIGSHYSPPVMACLTVGMLETVALRYRSAARSRGATLRAALLVALTLAVHVHSGFLYGGGKNYDVFRKPQAEGLFAVRAARQLPPSGVLLTERRLAAVCANRRDIRCWTTGYVGDPGAYDLAFFSLSNLEAAYGGAILAELERGESGVAYLDSVYAVLKRGAPSVLNDRVIGLAALPPVPVALTPKHAGREVRLAGGRVVRYWEGKGYKAPVAVSYGGTRRLGAGSFVACLYYRAEHPLRRYKGTWGSFSIHRLNDQGAAIASGALPQVATPPEDYLCMELEFEIPHEQDVEFRVTGGDAPLWLDRVEFAERNR